MASRFALHVETWKECEACHLHENRKRVVFARGKIPCDILFIGEAPGDSEDVIGLPFVGPAGCLLEENIIEPAIGYMKYKGRDLRIGYTNLVCCIPKQEGEKSAPDKAAIRACTERLNEFVLIANPKLIVAVGALARDEIIGKDLHVLNKRKVRVSLITELWKGQVGSITHPAAIIRVKEYSRDMVIRREVVALETMVEEFMKSWPT